MNAQDEKILEIFRETGALLEGHFILRSGLHSGHFFQCARVCEHMDRVEELVGMLAQKLGDAECETVMAPAIGGLVLGQETARQLKKRFIFAEKENGSLALRRNFKIRKGEKILIVEDVVTRGGRVQECIDIVKSNGGIPVAAAVLVDRSGGRAKFEVPCVSLLEFSFLRARQNPSGARLYPRRPPGLLRRGGKNPPALMRKTRSSRGRSRVLRNAVRRRFPSPKCAQASYCGEFFERGLPAFLLSRTGKEKWRLRPIRRFRRASAFPFGISAKTFLLISQG